MRRTLAGEFPIVNKYLVSELHNRGLWNRGLYEQLILTNGSVQGNSEIPMDIQELFKTAREIKKIPLLELAAIRGRYCCQTQSMNLYIEGKESDANLLHNCHMKSWKLGLKTASYYIHSMPAARPQNFVIDPRNEKKVVDEVVCESCSA